MTGLAQGNKVIIMLMPKSVVCVMMKMEFFLGRTSPTSLFMFCIVGNLPPFPSGGRHIFLIEELGCHISHLTTYSSSSQ
jgi:hypothetical protein